MTRVLLVDDDEMSWDMLSRRLIRRGFEVIFAVDGKQGVEAARREKPDIILMDMGLPVMDGWEATRCIKSDDATRGVSVIGLSARTMSGDRDKAIEAGCDDYDIKPIEFDRLIGKIERLLGLAKDPGALSEGLALHGFKNMLMLPSRDPSLLGGGTAMLDGPA